MHRTSFSPMGRETVLDSQRFSFSILGLDNADVTPFIGLTDWLETPVANW